MHQFELENIVNINFFGYNFSLTNGSIALLLTVVIALFFSISLFKSRKLVPSKSQSALELFLLTIRNIVNSSLEESGKKYIPFVFSIFLFILLLNLLGLIPGSFAQTSHISITFAIAMMVFFLCVLITLVKKGFGFFKIFLPSGTPWWLAPLLFILELFSYLVRPVSLSVRLAANMIAGHVMLDVIAFFVIMMGIFGILPFTFLSILMAFELFVAFLQAYIFSVFACVYINEACSEGH
jgi:F-type H+-transporting ATPase subunit a